MPVAGAADERGSVDADEAHNQALPCGAPQRGRGLEDLDGACLDARAQAPIDGFATRQGRLRLRGPFDRGEQAGLIFLNLYKQMAVCLAGRLEGFFGSAWRPA